jgi:ABC-2 type transport system ATP-binding protein
VSTEGLTKTFGAAVGIGNVSLSVGEGEIVGLLGPNGAGKSTTISCIAGLLRPDRGRIVICNEDALRHGRRARRRLGIAMQRTAVYPYLDVETNLRFFGALGGASGRDLARSVANTIELLNLGRLRATRVSQLSIGQQRLVHVAAAVIGRPRVLLLDEATANLDISARRVVLDMVRGLASQGTAVLYSSHYLGEVEDLCGRVVILFRGGVLAKGEVRELVRRHGGARVELALDGEVVVQAGNDLAAALRSVERIERIRSARVVQPSMEAVFLSLTGSQIGADGFATRDGDARSERP